MLLSLIVLLYLCGINLAAFALMGIDKYRARHRLWRIPEHTLFLFAILGGSPGALCGMFLFRHKTRHASFLLGMPAILLIQLLLAAGLFFFSGLLFF